MLPKSVIGLTKSDLLSLNWVALSDKYQLYLFSNIDFISYKILKSYIFYF